VNGGEFTNIRSGLDLLNLLHPRQTLTAPHGREESPPILGSNFLKMELLKPGFPTLIISVSNGISSSKNSHIFFSGITGRSGSCVNTVNVHPWVEAYLIVLMSLIDAPAEPSGGKYLEITKTLGNVYVNPLNFGAINLTHYKLTVFINFVAGKFINQ
jgi:hypothetical protein